MATLWPATLLVVTIAAVTLSSRRLALRLLCGGSGMDRLLVQLVVAWCQLALVAEACGAVHLAYGWSVALVHSGVAVCVLAAERLAPIAPVLPGGGQDPMHPGRAVGPGGYVRWDWRRAALLTGLGVASLATALSLGARSADFDTNRYHVVSMAHWLNSHELWSLPYAEPGDNTATEPSNSELVALTVALPTHDDRLAYAGNVVFCLLLAVAIAALARELGGSESVGLLAGWLLVASPAVFETQIHSLMSDAASAAGLTAAAALLLVWRRKPEDNGLLVVAALAAGLAAGSKFVALPVAVVLVLFAVTIAPPGRRIRAGGTMTAGVLCTAGFWYLRNAVATGNPIFPASLGGRLASNAGSVARDPISLLGQLPHHPAALLGWIAILAYSVGPALVLAALAPLALRRGVSRERRLTLVLVAVMLVIALATPFSGGGSGASMEVMGASLRFALPALAVAVALSAAVVPPRVLGLSCVLAGVGDLYYLASPQIGMRIDLRPDPSHLGLAVLLGLSVLAIAMCRPWANSALERLGSRRRLAVARRTDRAAVAGAARARVAIRTGALALAIPATAIGLGLLPRAITPAAVAKALDRAAQTGRPVVVVDAADVRSLLGDSLTSEPHSAGIGSTEGGRRQIDDPHALLTAIAAEHPAAVVLGEDSSVVPAPLLTPPPGWQLIGTIPGASVYLPGD